MQFVTTDLYLNLACCQLNLATKMILSDVVNKYSVDLYNSITRDDIRKGE